MIVEERDYRLVPGKANDFIAVYQAFGLTVQIRHLGKFLGYFTTEIGELNHVVAWWSYDSMADRESRREKMLSDPEWPEYLTRIGGLIDRQSSRILRPTSFSPLG